MERENGAFGVSIQARRFCILHHTSAALSAIKKAGPCPALPCVAIRSGEVFTARLLNLEVIIARRAVLARAVSHVKQQLIRARFKALCKHPFLVP